MGNKRKPAGPGQELRIKRVTILRARGKKRRKPDILEPRM